MLSGCACADEVGGVFGVLLRIEKVAGEAGVFETRCRGPRGFGIDEADARGWMIASGECRNVVQRPDGGRK